MCCRWQRLGSGRSLVRRRTTAIGSLRGVWLVGVAALWRTCLPSLPGGLPRAGHAPATRPNGECAVLSLRCTRHQFHSSDFFFVFQGYGAMSPGGGVQQDPTSSVPSSLLPSAAASLPPMSSFRGGGGGVAGPGPGPGGQVTPTGGVGVPTSSPAQALYCGGSHSPVVGVPQPQTSGDTLGKALASVSN